MPGEYYHIYNRGVNRQPIFFSSGNWDYFLSKLRQYFKAQYAEMVAYCLMPTHFHLLVLCKSEKYSTKVMQPLGISYTKAINEQQGRVGPLFQGPFKSEHINTNAYLLQISRYIHLNPVSGGLVKTPEDWRYSSYATYIGNKKDKLIHNEIIMDFFDSPKGYMEFVEEGQEGLEEMKKLLIDYE